MKKASAALAIVIVSTGLFSCKGHELCPAYSKKSRPEQKTVQASQGNIVKTKDV